MHPLRSAALCALALLLTACGGTTTPAATPAGAPTATPEAITVVASTNVYGDIVQQVGGDRVQVTSIISDPGQDPHSYEANTQNQLALSKAKVVVENGGGYDDFVDTMLKASGNTSVELINAVTVSGRTAPAGEELNEHIWYDLPSVAKIADQIATALAKADPASAATFTANADTFKQKLQPLQDRTARIAADAGGTAVAITEPVPGYLLDAAGLKNLTPDEFAEAIEEGDDVSPQVLAETLALFTGKKVAALVYNEQTSGPQTEQLKKAATDNGIAVVPVTETLPEGKDYIGWMAATLDALQAALVK
ncbi:metal ABC transporter substrate-binding protein [Acrocarpospora phusangensis]|uniref:Metal ABC transporter substrate-binding protein n=1 Tax=Acrocarpospora phusangensis TaxID=1070424 RepID=A0A919QA42_9ACTN|nr:zinc ABC transporter substrate-binding protein [Acrocarpospora phusangensis]GIH23623.1 metal ABC transporter substrate-binding protein [Acrocarpospora phusangensis]